MQTMAYGNWDELGFQEIWRGVLAKLLFLEFIYLYDLMLATYLRLQAIKPTEHDQKAYDIFLEHSGTLYPLIIFISVQCTTNY